MAKQRVGWLRGCPEEGEEEGLLHTVEEARQLEADYQVACLW